jgi:integrase/recombinase XerD
MTTAVNGDLGRAIDLYLGELARRNCSAETLRTYRRILDLFADRFEAKPLDEITVTDCRTFLDRWSTASASTLAQSVSILRGFFGFLLDEGMIERTPMERIKRPRRLPPEETDVVSVSTSDAEKVIEACLDWQELLCVTTALYLGARRGALAKVRRRDVDLEAGTIRFLEKGRKVAIKPMPDEYLAILSTAEDDGVWSSPEDYLIPNRRPASVRRRERSDKIIWETVTRVARRAGVRAHVHALRAAFAVHFIETHPGEALALQDLLGHKRMETTVRHYLRRRDRQRLMGAVRDLSWSSLLPPNAQEAHTGFEPVLPP